MKYTLKNTNERINSLEKKLDEILSKLENPKVEDDADSIYELNIETLERRFGLLEYPAEIVTEIKMRSDKFTDENDNVFVQLPAMYYIIDNEDDKNVSIKFSFHEFENANRLEPQAISKYKNSWINGKIRSIPNVAPDCSQFSYIKSKKLCKWANGEMLNWKTILYIQIIWLFAYGTKENAKILPNEDYSLKESRDCGFADTGKGVGEFLGIEQLFTSGRNLFDFDGWYIDTDLFLLFKKLSDLLATKYNDMFGAWGDYCNCKGHDYKAAFNIEWSFDMNSSWDYDCIYALRLCKPYNDDEI